MQYKTYDKNSLSLIDSGYVINYEIDDDYLINNNSKIYVSNVVTASSGDIVCLIKNAGAYHKGVITSIDNVNGVITYKDFKELFNNEILSPFRSIEKKGVSYECIKMLKNIIYYTYSAGYLVKLVNGKLTGFKVSDLTLLANGKIDIQTTGTVDAYYENTESKFNLKDYLIDLFEKYNVTVNFDINFNSRERATTAYSSPTGTLNVINGERQPRMVFKINQTQSTEFIIKDNILGATFNYEEQKAPDATIAYIVNASNTDLMQTYFLLNDNSIEVKDSARVTKESIVKPTKTVVCEFSPDNSSGLSEEEQMLNLAKSRLLKKEYYHCIELMIPTSNKMLDYELLQLGAKVKIVTKDAVYNSIFTGMKEKNNNMLTLIFGKSRRNYTDKIVLNLRRKKEK